MAGYHMSRKFLLMGVNKKIPSHGSGSIDTPPMGAALEDPLPWEQLYRIPSHGSGSRESPPMGAALENPLTWERL